MNFDLRPYQTDCCNAVVKAYTEGVYQQLVVAATGTGKTVVFTKLLEKLRPLLPSGKTLIFAHQEELVDQTIASVVAGNPDLKVGKEMAEHWADADCDVVVSCVASIGRAGSDRLKRFGEFALVIVDEAHHAIAQTYLNVFEHTGVLLPDSKKLLLGFTATPKRMNRVRPKKGEQLLDDADLISLKSVFKKIVYKYPIRRAVKDGWLCEPKGFIVTSDVNLDEVKVTAGEFQQDQLQKAINVPKRNADAVTKWKELAYKPDGSVRLTVDFCAGIEHAKAKAAAYVAQGVKAEAIWGDDPERTAKLKRHEKREIDVLCNDKLLIEGYDNWRIEFIVLSKPTRSSSAYTQMIGRGTRIPKTLPKGVNLKDAVLMGIVPDKIDCYVLDNVDSHKHCSIVTLPSLVGLNPDMNMQGMGLNEAAEKIEEIQETNPTVDFSELKDLKDVDTFIKSIDIFAEPPQDVDLEKITELEWVACKDGTYTLLIPEKADIVRLKKYYAYEHKRLHIERNELDEWELSITQAKQVGARKLGTFDTLDSAVKEADKAVRKNMPERVKTMKRVQMWHTMKPTIDQKKLLRRLTKTKQVLWCLCDDPAGFGELCGACKKRRGLTSGQASKAISKLKAGGV